MKLLTHTLRFLSVSLIIILSLWSAVFYFRMLEEIYDSIDDGLDNYRLLIIEKAKTDPSILNKSEFGESNYSIREITALEKEQVVETVKDTLMYMENEKDYEPVRMLSTAFSFEGRHFRLNVISSMVEEDDLIRNLLYSVLGLYIVILGSVILVNKIILKRIWKPFYKVMDKMNSFRLGSNELITPAQTEVQEFRELNETLATLLNRSQDTYNSQKQFIENAAHELQTPLAISINRLELLAEKSGMSESSMDTIGKVIQTLERLARLNKSLLLLSRIENRQYVSEGKISFNVLLKRVIEDFGDLAAFREVSITLEEPGIMLHNINSDLAEIFFTNLVKNAIIHNISGGFVKIIVNDNSVTIENSGTEEELDNGKMFKRFYKNSTQKNTTGLGLSVAKAIAELYSLQIDYSFLKTHRFKVLGSE